jgi:hypothetical protein
LKDIESIISELEQQRSAIDRAISALREVTGTRPASGITAPANTQAAAMKKRTITPAGRKRIAEAMKRPWAAKRAGQSGQQSPSHDQRATGKKAQAKKRRLSAEGRKRIIEATKRRWAAKRAQQTSGVGQPAVSNRSKRARKKTAA